MTKQAETEIVGAAVLEHAAVGAWAKLRPDGACPSGLRILQEPLLKGTKSAVYELRGAGPDGSDVIAKRCREATALLERTIYEDVLPRLPVPALKYYGMVSDEDGGWSWEFLEKAGGAAYSPRLEDHRAAAERWLGLMHTSASCIDMSGALPDRGPGYYLEQLRLTREKILGKIGNPALEPGDVEVLENIVAQFEVVRSQWSGLKKFCDEMPTTLVHGDFVSKNVRIQHSSPTITVLPFDWATAGWGIPAADLTQLDPVGYWSVVKNEWSHLDLDTIQHMANVGKIFRSIMSVGWEGENLAYEWVEAPMQNMRIYDSSLTKELAEEGWRA